MFPIFSLRAFFFSSIFFLFSVRHPIVLSSFVLHTSHHCIWLPCLLSSLSLSVYIYHHTFPMPLPYHLSLSSPSTPLFSSLPPSPLRQSPTPPHSPSNFQNPHHHLTLILFLHRLSPFSLYISSSRELLPLNSPSLHGRFPPIFPLFLFFLFLDAPSHLYMRSCPSVGPSVRPSVRWSRVIFKGEKYAY